MCMCVHALSKASKENTAKQQSAGGLGQGSPLTPCRVKRYKAALSGPARQLHTSQKSAQDYEATFNLFLHTL